MEFGMVRGEIAHSPPHSLLIGTVVTITEICNPTGNVLNTLAAMQSPFALGCRKFGLS